MAAPNDVVQLADGTVGVVERAENEPPGNWIVHFLNRRETLADSLLTTLAATSFNVGDEVTVWPDSGTVDSVASDTVTVSVTRRRRIDERTVANIDGTAVVAKWMLILDNDTRITNRE